MNACIYSLRDPKTKEIRYIGQTKRDIRIRLYCHLAEIKTEREKNRKKSWIKSLLKLNLVPEIEIIEQCKVDELNDKEIYWINFYKDKVRLLNMTNGGSVYNTNRKFRNDERPVFRLNEQTREIVEFKNTLHAANSIKKSRATMPKAIYAKARAGGFFWSYNKEELEKFYPKVGLNYNTYAVYNETFYKEYHSINDILDDLNIPRTCKSRIGYRLSDGKLYKGYYFKRIRTIIMENRKAARLKRGELLEKPEKVNQQPSISSNAFEGSTTNIRVLSNKIEDSNDDKSALHF